ncbi:hypothetical protein FB480_101227 [Agrobacterium vitis]|nr:hypothetical protein FB480_101227 [Agrobacterium vitis]
MSYLERQPKIVTFGAFDFGNDPVAGDIPPLNVPDGYSIDPVQNDLYQRARRLEREKGVSFADAVDLVRGR